MPAEKKLVIDIDPGLFFSGLFQGSIEHGFVLDRSTEFFFLDRAGGDQQGGRSQMISKSFHSEFSCYQSISGSSPPPMGSRLDWRKEHSVVVGTTRTEGETYGLSCVPVRISSTFIWIILSFKNVVFSACKDRE
jgi:hypothetical protein